MKLSAGWVEHDAVKHESQRTLAARAMMEDFLYSVTRPKRRVQGNFSTLFGGQQMADQSRS